MTGSVGSARAGMACCQAIREPCSSASRTSMSRCWILAGCVPQRVAAARCGTARPNRLAHLPGGGVARSALVVSVYLSSHPDE
jgi:hypothetical protein